MVSEKDDRLTIIAISALIVNPHALRKSTEGCPQAARPLAKLRTAVEAILLRALLESSFEASAAVALQVAGLPRVMTVPACHAAMTGIITAIEKRTLVATAVIALRGGPQVQEKQRCQCQYDSALHTFSLEGGVRVPPAPAPDRYHPAPSLPRDASR
jgi:hypothetical protein